MIIAHIDMNCFYASVEEKYNPSLKGKPLAVAGEEIKRHGIIVTSNYEARKKGIKTTMRVGEAKKLCPTLKIVSPNFARYQKESKKVFSLIKTYLKKIEIVSIDEAYIDLTEEENPIKKIYYIQKKIYEDLKLPSSVGVSYNKFFAKMASNMKKPKGFTIINKKNYQKLLYEMEVGKMHGCGKSGAKKLNEQGIYKIKDLAEANEVILYSILGIQGLRLKKKARGEDRRKVEIKVERKSIGNSKTFSKDLIEDREILFELNQIAKKVSQRAKNAGKVGNNISITIKFNDFKTITRSKKINSYINEEKTLAEEAIGLFLDNYSFDKGIRLIGVSLNNIISSENIKEQLDIFTDYENRKDFKLKKAILQLNKKYGKEVVKEIRKGKKENIITTSFSKDFLD
ncbi:DNA polymerase IV [Gemelliphila asaccharolytica]|uniref:DNA polymerase IV n=1 Tax=Gemelliphila asaccharolytica TaxID=502393 RepID=A0ABR5TKK2_9BACL|nr:DNA polymerase IV [Gemella asaccharolytica]KXB56284.1 putative DNA polymerase IV [Gemella asaccharolytica]